MTDERMHSARPDRDVVPPEPSRDRGPVSRPRLPAGARALLVVVTLFAVLAVASAVAGLVASLVEAAGVDTGATAPDAARVATGSVLTTVLTVAAVWGLARGIDRRPLAGCGLRGGRGAVGLTIVMLLVVPATVTFALWMTAAFGGITPVPAASATQVLPLLLLGLAQAFLLQGFPEELLFRGYLMTSLGRRPWVAYGSSVALFTVLHLVSNGGQQGPLDRVVYLVMPLGIAVLAGATRLVTGSVWPAVAVHGGCHVGILLAMLTGVPAQGEAAWLVVGLALVALGLLVLVVGHRRLPGATAPR